MTRQTGISQFNKVLTQIDRSLREINSKLALLMKTQSSKTGTPGSSPDIGLDVETLLSLPDHLRKSAMTLSEFGEATARQVARKTGRTRAAVSDYLKGNCTLDEVLTEFPLNGTNGVLSASYADPSPEAMRFMMTRDRKWESNALRRILAAKRKLLQEKKIDYMIFDTSPGMYYSSVNAVAAADVAVLIMKYDDFDIEGTKLLIEGIIDALGKRTGLILNRIVCEGCGGPVPDDELRRIEASIIKSLGRPVLGSLPCLWQLQREGSKELFAVSQPNHLFVQTLRGIADRIRTLGAA